MGRGAEENFAINPLTPMDHSRGRRLEARRCGARTPTGTPCQRRTIRGRKRCRLHGGAGPPILVSLQSEEPNSETPTPASPRNPVIYAALGLPPPGTPSISLIPPKALVVVDVAELAPVATPPNEIGHLCCARPTPRGTPSISLIPPQGPCGRGRSRNVDAAKITLPWAEQTSSRPPTGR